MWQRVMQKHKSQRIEVLGGYLGGWLPQPSTYGVHKCWKQTQKGRWKMSSASPSSNTSSLQWSHNKSHTHTQPSHPHLNSSTYYVAFKIFCLYVCLLECKPFEKKDCVFSSYPLGSTGTRCMKAASKYLEILIDRICEHLIVYSQQCILWHPPSHLLLFHAPPLTHCCPVLSKSSMLVRKLTQYTNAYIRC